MNKRKLNGLLWITVLLCFMLAFSNLQTRLLEFGLLNKKDIGFAGVENGSFYDYLTNIWYWDAFFGLLMFMTLIGFITGGILLYKYGKTEKN